MFDTWREATTAAKKLRAAGRKDVVTDVNTLCRYCCEDLQLSIEGRRTYTGWRSKNTIQLGFYLEKKNGRYN